MSKEYVMQLEATIANFRRDNDLLKDIKNEQEKVLSIIFEKGLPLPDYGSNGDTLPFKGFVVQLLRKRGLLRVVA